MASDKQIAANRANAQHCTGPTTPEGRARSSQNALKTGIDAKSEVMRCESRAEYDTLIAEYYERFHPTVPEERALVDLLIKSEWLCRRYISVECALWERGFVDIEENSLTRVFNVHDKAFDRVDRRMNSAQRNLQKALKHLAELQAKRASEPEQTLPNRDGEGAALETSAEATKPLNPKLVSFLQNVSEPAIELSEITSETPKKEDDPPIAA